MINIAPILFIISIYFIFSTLIVSLLLTPIINKLSIRFRFMDKPGERKIHKKPVPMSGGIIIALSMFVVFSLNLYFIITKPLFFSRNPFLIKLVDNIDIFIKWKEFAFIALAALIVWIFGLVDDYYKSERLALLKLGGQFIAASVVVFYADVHITFFSPVIISKILSIIWIVGIINSFNLLDNMDGLSCGVACVCSSVLLGIAIWQGEIIVASMSAILLGALFAFLIFNFHPAKIFLGDNGSMLIGLIMSILTLKISYLKNAEGYFFPIFIPVIILAIPLVDTFSVIFIRIMNKKPVYIGDKNHISHRLTKINFSIREAVMIIYLLTMATSISGFLLIKADIWFSLIIFFQVFVIVFLFFLLLVRGKMPEKLNEND